MECIFDDILNEEYLGEEIFLDDNFDLDYYFAQALQKSEEEAITISRRMLKEDEMLAKSLQEEEENRKRELQRKEEEDRQYVQKMFGQLEPGVIHTVPSKIGVPFYPSPSPSPSPSPLVNDQELARAIAREEKIKNDEYLARKLQEELESERLILQLEREEKEQKDAEIARLMAQQEEEEEQRRKKRRSDEKRDEEFAKSLYESEINSENEKMLAKLRDAELAQKLDAEEQQKLARKFQLKEEDRRRREAMREADEKRRKAEVEKIADAPEFGDLKKYIGNISDIQRSMGFRVAHIRKVIRPDLQNRFDTAWARLKSRYGEGSVEATPKAAFHGTKSNRLASIEKKGLLVPGTSGVTHATDSGWYGRGIYLSPNPSYSLGYSDDGKLIVCAVLMGKVFRCSTRMDGAPLMPGCDSHESPDGQEYILFSADHVLPLFVFSTKN